MHWSEKIVRKVVEEVTKVPLKQWDGGDIYSALSEASVHVSGPEGVRALVMAIAETLYNESYDQDQKEKEDGN